MNKKIAFLFPGQGSQTVGMGADMASAQVSCSGVPPLPPVGEALRFAYLSHVAVDDDRDDVLVALVADQCRRANKAGSSYVVTAFVPRHPFHDAIARRFRYRAYDSVLYLTFWPDGEPFVRVLDQRIPQPEVAVL